MGRNGSPWGTPPRCHLVPRSCRDRSSDSVACRQDGVSFRILRLRNRFRRRLFSGMCKSMTISERVYHLVKRTNVERGASVSSLPSVAAMLREDAMRSGSILSSLSLPLSLSLSLSISPSLPLSAPPPSLSLSLFLHHGGYRRHQLKRREGRGEASSGSKARKARDLR